MSSARVAVKLPRVLIATTTTNAASDSVATPLAVDIGNSKNPQTIQLSIVQQIKLSRATNSDVNVAATTAPPSPHTRSIDFIKPSPPRHTHRTNATDRERGFNLYSTQNEEDLMVRG